MVGQPTAVVRTLQSFGKIQICAESNTLERPNIPISLVYENAVVGCDASVIGAERIRSLRRLGVYFDVGDHLQRTTIQALLLGLFYDIQQRIQLTLHCRFHRSDLEGHIRLLDDIDSLVDYLKIVSTSQPWNNLECQKDFVFRLT